MMDRRASRQLGVMKLLAPFLMLAALGYALAGWVYAKRIEQTLVQAEHSRLQFTLADLKADFEQGLAAGYGLRDLANAQAALEAEARLDPDIDLIALLDPQGNIIQQAGAHPGGTGAPAVSTVLAGPGGETLGSLAVWPGSRTRDAVTARARTGLALAALCALLFTAVAAMATMSWLVRRREEVLAAVAEGLAHPAQVDDPRIAGLVNEVNQQANTTLVSISAARHLLGQRDTDG